MMMETKAGKLMENLQKVGKGNDDKILLRIVKVKERERESKREKIRPTEQDNDI